MIELLVVLVLAALMLVLVGGRVTEWRDKAAARQAAQVFARDLAMARFTAQRGREGVVIRFYEGSRWYRIATDSETEIVRRRFDNTSEIHLSDIDLRTAGDTLRFNAAGFAQMSGMFSTAGEARFTAGLIVYNVVFNSLGASTVGEL